MSDLRLLRLLIAAWWLILLLAVVFDVVLVDYLPGLLQQYLESDQYYSGWLDSIPEWLALSLLLPLVLAIALGFIGLYLVRRWGRTLYTVSIVLAMLLALGFAPMVTHPVAELFAGLGVLIDGALLMLIWRSPLFNAVSNSG